MASLVLGPLLRHVGETHATIWVETDARCVVEVLGARKETFHVEGHHYALVEVAGLEPGTTTEYEVLIDGERAWPLEDTSFPASVIHTPHPDGPVTISFGSCRVEAPHEPPYTLSKDQDPEGREVDALRCLAGRLCDAPADERPHLLLMLGDQIYADEVAPGTCEFIRSRRDVSIPPGETLADFEEYTRLYRESWSEPRIRWLLSTVPTAMIFDDHDVHDDWNTSHEWIVEMRSHGWWDERIVGGFMSYWIYQHIGNLSPGDLADDDTFQRVCELDDAGPLLRDFAFRADRAVQGSQWTFRRDVGPARLVMIDSRAGRVLDPGERSMVDEREWRYIEEAVRGPHRHLLLGTSLPWLLAPGMHHLESWNEAIADGAWGALGRWLGEKLRQGLDLEHWGAFRTSFERLARIVEEVGSGHHGEPPATIVALSGDVHHAYLAEVAFPRGSSVRSHVYQAVCSPFRNPLDHSERRAIRFAASRAGELIGRLLARSARVPHPPIRWRFTHPQPWFDNMVATLTLDAESAQLRIERTVRDETTLESVLERRL